jgi:mRNA interferase MazF
VIFDTFDVVIVDFPFADMPMVKRRPAIVLSAHEKFGAPTGVAVTAMISAPLRTSWPHDIAITDTGIAGLHKPSFIRMKLMTVDFCRFERRVGTLGEADRRSVGVALREVLAGVL